MQEKLSVMNQWHSNNWLLSTGLEILEDGLLSQKIV